MTRSSVNVHRFCEGYGIRVRPIRRAREPRPANTIYGGRIVARMLRGRGEDHAGLVLMCAKAAGADCLYGDVLFAVSEVLRIHGARWDRRTAVETFGHVDMRALRYQARMLARTDAGAMTAVSAALAILIASQIVFGEPSFVDA